MNCVIDLKLLDSHPRVQKVTGFITLFLSFFVLLLIGSGIVSRVFAKVV